MGSDLADVDQGILIVGASNPASVSAIVVSKSQGPLGMRLEESNQ
jgi:hypothetical protein